LFNTEARYFAAGMREPPDRRAFGNKFLEQAHRLKKNRSGNGSCRSFSADHGLFKIRLD